MRRANASTRERFAAAGLLVLFALAAGAGLASDSSVADEHPHILSGYLFWKSGRFAGGLDNPPLGQLVVSLPLVLLGRPYRFPSDEFLWLCRLPVLVSGLLLGLLLWRWGRALGGAGAGLAALGALALEPNLLAHAHLATLDFLVTVLWWLVLWWGRALVLDPAAGDAADRPAPPTALVLFAVLAAAAVLVKHTALLLFPSMLLLVAVAPDAARRRRGALALGLALLLGVLAAHAIFGFDAQRFGLPEPLVASIEGKLAHRSEVRFAYLAGERSESGFLGYYVVALLLKTPLPLLGFAGWGVWRLVRRGQWRELAFFVVPSVIVVTAFTALRVHIGIRHVLPVFPALLLLAAVGAREAWSRRRMRPAVVLLGALWAAGVGRVAPQYLAYFNVLAGGPAGGHRWLLDSNLDWGQDDGRLADFLDSSRGAQVTVCPDPLRPRLGHLAVSANALHNLQRRTARPYSWLREFPAAGFAGWSWRIYELDRPDFERQVAARPEDPAAAWGLAAVLWEAGERQPALEVLERAATRIRDAEGRRELATLAARLAASHADWDEAGRWAALGLGVRPSDPELQALAGWFDREEALGEAPPERLPGLVLDLGIYAAAIGEIETSVAAIERAAALAPDDPEIARSLAIARVRQGDFAAAVALFERPDLRASAAAELDLCRALARAQRAVDEGSPGVEPELLLELGRAHFDSGQYDRAAAVFVRLLREHPEHRLALAYLCEMQVRSKMRIVNERLGPRPIELDARRRTEGESLASPSG